MKEYLQKYRGLLLMTGLWVFLFHGAKLNSDIIGIDTEDLLRQGEVFYGGWLETGRQGLVFLKYLFGNVRFLPYFSGFMTLFLFTAAVTLFLGLWDTVSGKNIGGMAGNIFAGLLWVSHPVMTEQFYFSLQSSEICMATALTAFALYLSLKQTQKHHPALIAGSVITLILTFSTYQSFVVLYIFGAVSVLLLQALRDISEGKEMRGGILLRRVLPYCGIFMTAFLLNSLITNLFFSSSGYLQNQIFWGHASVKDCFHAMAGHVLKVFTGYDSLFYNAGMGILTAADFVLLLIFLRKASGKGKGTAAVVVFFYMALPATLFMMTLVLGGAPAMRSQLVLPAATGFLAALGMRLWGLCREERKSGFRFWAPAVCLSAVCIVSGLEQAKVTGSLYYTDRCRYEQDAALGRALIDRVEQVKEDCGRPEDFPVIVIGSREFSGNASCVTGEIIGRSFFNYDTDVEPKYFWSSRRILGFLHTLGADYNLLPEERMAEAAEYGAGMPEWPARDSVRLWNEMIIIRLHME